MTRNETFHDRAKRAQLNKILSTVVGSELGYVHINHGHGSGSWNSETAYYTIHITSESSTHNHPLSRSCFVLSPLETKQAASRPSSLHARTAEELQKSDNESNQLRDTGCARARTAGTPAVAGTTGYSNADSWRVTLACGATRLCCAPDFASLQGYTSIHTPPKHPGTNLAACR